MDDEVKKRDEAEVDRVLGNLAIIKVSDMQKFGGPGAATLYRARRAGMIEFVKNGRLSGLRRGVAKAHFASTAFRGSCSSTGRRVSRRTPRRLLVQPENETVAAG